MFLSTGGVIAILLSLFMAAFPPANGTHESAVQDMVNSGVAAVSMPTAESTGDLPEFNLGGQVDTLNGLVSVARGEDLVAQTVQSEWLPQEIRQYALEHPEYANGAGNANSPTWVATMLAGGEQWVFAGVWYRCGGLGMGLGYMSTSRADPAPMAWNQISEDARVTVFYTCYNKLYGS